MLPLTPREQMLVARINELTLLAFTQEVRMVQLGDMLKKQTETVNKMHRLNAALTAAELGEVEMHGRMC